jgi:hypothetical protein
MLCFRPASSCGKKHTPMTILTLLDIDKGLVHSSPLDISVHCILLLCFFCQLCAGELLCPNEDYSMFSPTCHATFANITPSTAANVASNLHLPWSKKWKKPRAMMCGSRQEPSLDPIHATHKHYIKNALELHHPIVSYHNEHGKITTLTRSKFICHINQILHAANKNYPHITGHCL